MHDRRSSRTLIILRHGGTHLIKPIVKALVGKWQGGKGYTIIERDPLGPTVVCIRDPRNRIISAFRWKYKGSPIDPIKADRWLANFISTKKPLTGIAPVAFMHTWADKWMDRDDVMYVRFEDLIGHKRFAIRTLAKIVRYAGASVSNEEIEEQYAKIFKRGPFWTGEHSKYEKWFGPLASKAWEEAEGPLLVKKMGY